MTAGTGRTLVRASSETNRPPTEKPRLTAVATNREGDFVFPADAARRCKRLDLANLPSITPLRQSIAAVRGEFAEQTRQ